MRHVVLFVFALLPVLLAGSGCLNSCEQLCAEEARYIDGCLEEWDALWPDFGYDGLADVDVPAKGLAAGDAYDRGPAEEYDSRCKERYEAAIFFSHPEEARDIRTQCSTRIRSVALAVGCLDYSPSGGDSLDPNGEDGNGVPPRPAR